MPDVKIIEEYAFYCCTNLTDVEFSYELETVGESTFDGCTSLKWVKMPKVKVIGICAFMDSGVEELEFGEELETLRKGAFRDSKLRRIVIPLKNDMFQWNDQEETYNQFHECYDLTTIDLVGGIHKTVSSLHLESWRDEMNGEILRINQILPVTDRDEKSSEIVEWIQLVINKIENYKSEHLALLEEVATLLELALWKAKLDEFKDEDDRDSGEKKIVRKAPKIDARKEARITSGADIIIKNVLSYLKMD